MNILSLSGVVVRDPVIIVKPDSIKVAKYTLAVKKSRPDKRTGRDVDYINITSFGDIADFIEERVRKGTKLNVCGSIENNEYIKDGVKIYTYDIIGNIVEWI